jgi:hypothetical protein
MRRMKLGLSWGGRNGDRVAANGTGAELRWRIGSPDITHSPVSISGSPHSRDSKSAADIEILRLAITEYRPPARDSNSGQAYISVSVHLHQAVSDGTKRL